MHLVLDAGNSTVSAALADGTRLVRVVHVPIGRAVDDATIERALDEAFGEDATPWSRIEAIGLASVVPTATAAVVALADRRGLPVVLATPDTVPIEARVDHPERVGPDRLVNALAAARLHGTPVVVVDVGTATTWDCVDASGAFVGGAIAPGLQLGLAALAERTALLPRVGATLPDRAIGTDTIEAIRSGTVLGQRELVEGLTRRIRAELAILSGVRTDEVRTVLTGGMVASPWGETLEGFDVRDRDLTLRGLAIVAEQALAGRADRAASAGPAAASPSTGA
jgi:type III pantothenate kinase